MNTPAHRNEDNAKAPVLSMALELSNKSWKLMSGIGGERRQMSVLAANLRLPVMYGYSESGSDSGLISCGPHWPELYRRTAAYVDRIIKGAKLADLPVKRSIEFELVISMKTAKFLGVKIPQSVLVCADRVIE